MQFSEQNELTWEGLITNALVDIDIYLDVPDKVRLAKTSRAIRALLLPWEHRIAIVIVDIGKYLDVRDTLRLSQTSHAIRRVLVDDASSRHPKIKVQSFSLAYPGVSRPRLDRGDVILSTEAFNKLHFPSLRRISFLHHGTAGMEKEAFVQLARNLQFSENVLEELEIDVGWLLRYSLPDAGRLEMLGVYEALASNLKRCKKLRKISITNSHRSRTPGPARRTFYLHDLLLVLIPVMEARATSLEEVTLQFGSWAILQHSSTPASDNHALDLFTAVLKLRTLKEFNLQLLDLEDTLFVGSFLRAAEIVSREIGMLPSADTLGKFEVDCTPHENPDDVQFPLPAPVSLRPLLSLLGGCSSLHSFILRIPPGCWNAGSESILRNALSNKPHMSFLGIDFQGYESASGKCVEGILDYVEERRHLRNNEIHIWHLKCADTVYMESDLEEELGRYFSTKGEACLDWNEYVNFHAQGGWIRW